MALQPPRAVAMTAPAARRRSLPGWPAERRVGRLGDVRAARQPVRDRRPALGIARADTLRRRKPDADRGGRLADLAPGRVVEGEAVAALGHAAASRSGRRASGEQLAAEALRGADAQKPRRTGRRLHVGKRSGVVDASAEATAACAGVGVPGRFTRSRPASSPSNGSRPEQNHCPRSAAGRRDDLAPGRVVEGEAVAALGHAAALRLSGRQRLGPPLLAPAPVSAPASRSTASPRT